MCLFLCGEYGVRHRGRTTCVSIPFRDEVELPEPHFQLCTLCFASSFSPWKSTR